MIPRTRPLGRISLGVLVLALGASSLSAQEPAAIPDSVPDRERHVSTADRWLAPDKAAHIFAGYWTAGAGYAAASRLDADRAGRTAAAAAAGLAAGTAKELFDALVQKERFSWRDLAADTAGIALLVAVTAAAEP